MAAAGLGHEEILSDKVFTWEKAQEMLQFRRMRNLQTSAAVRWFVTHLFNRKRSLSGG